MKRLPDFSIEEEFSGIVCGVDEAGRGALCGPVVAAAVILDKSNWPEGINDSKVLSARKRESLYANIFLTGTVGVGSVEAYEVDRLNVLQASLLAMERAVSALNLIPAMALIDGDYAPRMTCPTRCLVGGDGISLSIAAASIVAKVSRDRIMRVLASKHPGYGWDANVGYPTRQHLEALQHIGVTEHHRRTFGPVARALAG